MPLKEEDLRQFIGSESVFRHFTGLMYTEGVQFMAENGGGQGAYWLIDAIGSYQGEKVIRETRMLQEFQLWELEVQENRTAVLTCRVDSDAEPVVRQEIEYTDFDLPKIKLYVEGGVLLLPSEH